MSSNFYDDVRGLADELIASGNELLGEEIKLAVDASSTSSEILMRLRKTFEDALEQGELRGEQRERITRALEAVNRVLPG